MSTHSRSTRWLVGALCGLAGGGSSAAQSRPHVAPIAPSIPEPACTRLTLQATARVQAGRREVALRVVNDDPGGFPARVHRDVEVQRLEHGRWERVSVAGFHLRASCTASVDECVELAPRASLDVVAWTGMQGDGQCACTRCSPAPAGTYRFVVRTCQRCFRPTESESAPFTLP